MTELGSSPYLTSDFDFEVDETGKIRTTSGLPELQKDVSYFLTANLEDELGRRLDNSSLKRAEVVARDVLNADPRIETVIGVTARDTERQEDRIEVISEVNVDTGPQELVFEVNP